MWHRIFCQGVAFEVRSTLVDQAAHLVLVAGPQCGSEIGEPAIAEVKEVTSVVL